MPFVVEIARGASVMWAHCEQTVVCEGADPGNERQALELFSPPVWMPFGYYGMIGAKIVILTRWDVSILVVCWGGIIPLWGDISVMSLLDLRRVGES